MRFGGRKFEGQQVSSDCILEKVRVLVNWQTVWRN